MHSIDHLSWLVGYTNWLLTNWIWHWSATVHRMLGNHPHWMNQCQWCFLTFWSALRNQICVWVMVRWKLIFGMVHTFCPIHRIVCQCPQHQYQGHPIKRMNCYLTSRGNVINNCFAFSFRFLGSPLIFHVFLYFSLISIA